MPTKASTTTKARAAKKRPAAKKAPAAKRKTPARTTSAKATVGAADVATQEAILQLQARVETLEEKLCGQLAVLVAAVGELRTARPDTQGAAAPNAEAGEARLRAALQQHVEQHIEPLSALLRRVDERVGFIGNRLKSSGGGGPGRNKTWRRDQAGNARARGQNGQRQGHHGQPPPPSQNWTPPSAESIKGLFAPRRMGLDHLAAHDDEE